MHAHGFDATLFMRGPTNSDPVRRHHNFCIHSRNNFILDTASHIKSRDMATPPNSAIAAGFRFLNLLAQDALWQPGAGWELRDSGCDPQENVPPIAVGTYGFYLIANCAAKLDHDGCPVSSATRCAQRVDMAIDMPWGNLAIRQKPGTD
jgi:hypothetical protein